MKIGLSKLKILFVILFSTLLSITPFNPVRLTDPKASLEVCAQDVNYQDLGSGISCVPNYTDCTAPGYENLAATLGSMKYGADINSSLLQQSIQSAIGSKVNSACSPEGYNQVIVRWFSLPEVTSGKICVSDVDQAYRDNSEIIPFNDKERLLSTDLGSCKFLMPTTTNAGKNSFAIPTFCPSGWQASQSINRKAVTDGFDTGCCPTGYTYTQGADSQLAGDYTKGVCCRVIDGVRADHVLDGTLTCGYNQFKDGGFTRDDQLDGEYRSPQDAADAARMQQPSVIAGFRLNGNGNYESVTSGGEVWGSNVNTDTLFRPQYGFPISPNNGGLTSLTYSNDTFNPKSCPGISSCALVTGSGGTTTVVNGSILATQEGANLSCTRCFNAGEPISVNSNTQMMNICDPSAAGFTRTQALCNSSVIDTVACLGGANSDSQNAGSNGIETSNYDLCCACREQGGVWTGIGCTDTTPSGLITGLIRIVYGVMGGVALIMLIYAGVMYQTGNEANVKKARESIIRTVTGLIVLTFSILILRVIGINVLDILPAGSI